MDRKTYVIRVEDPSDREAVEKMLQHYIVNGKNLSDAVVDQAKQFVAKNSSPCTLVTENQLVEICQKELGWTTARSSIVQYRRRGLLQDKDGPWFFQNKQNRVLYNLEKMLDFINQRRERPKSRIKHDVHPSGGISKSPTAEQ